jgi:GT2 family glycosyltransferase
VFLRQEVFRAAGGFDEVLFPMYCNDVDLSIRIRLLGYKLNFYHEIKVVHNKSFNQNMQIESSDFEINDSMVASILLLRKYGLITKAEELMTKNTILKELVLNDARFNLIEEVKYGNSRDARTIKEFLLQPNFGNREF